MEVRYWLDSGANIHSKLERVVDIDLEPEEWEEMTPEEQDEYMKDYAWDTLEWGYEVVK